MNRSRPQEAIITAVAAAAARNAELANEPDAVPGRHLVDLDEEPMSETAGAEAVPGIMSDESWESDVQSRVSESNSDTAVAAPAQSQDTAVPASSSCPHTAVAASSSLARVLFYKDGDEAKQVDAAVRAEIMSKVSEGKRTKGLCCA